MGAIHDQALQQHTGDLSEGGRQRGEGRGTSPAPGLLRCWPRRRDRGDSRRNSGCASWDSGAGW